MLKLKKHFQFQRVYKKGEVFRESNVRLYLLANGLQHNRIGISISSKKAPLSVNRNRSRRLLSECYRMTEDLLKGGYDIVFTAERDLSKTKFLALTKALKSLYRKSKILR